MLGRFSLLFNLHLFSERSILNNNNLISKDLWPGQILKIPILKSKKNTEHNKNHIDINHVTDLGFISLVLDK
jgi:hypothetical protein